MSNDQQIVKGVDQSFRRTWDQAVYAQKAQERADREQFPDDERWDKKKILSMKDMRPVQARDEELDLEKNLNKFQKVNPDAGEQHSGGFYCEVCDVSLKDSNAYLDHINGKKHQRALGTSLRPDRATVDQVRERLKKHRDSGTTLSSIDRFEDKMKRLREQEEKRKEELMRREREEKQRKKELAKKKKEERKAQQLKREAPPDPLLEAMGLPTGFGTSKK